jgi:hypothetical protein
VFIILKSLYDVKYAYCFIVSVTCSISGGSVTLCTMTGMKKMNECCA